MIDFSAIKKLTIGGVDLKQLFIDGVRVWKSGYKNWVPFSTTEDGKTIYNGKGYKDGYRVRSGGVETAHGNATCTGFISVSAGDTVRISGASFATAQSANAINASDAGFANIGQLTPSYADSGYGIFAYDGAWFSYSWKSVVEEKPGVWKWVVPPAASGVAYIRVSAYTDAKGEDLIVTINEEIT